MKRIKLTNRSQIAVDGVSICLGYYATIEEAGKAYKLAFKEVYGEL